MLGGRLMRWLANTLAKQGAGGSSPKIVFFSTKNQGMLFGIV